MPFLQEVGSRIAALWKRPAPAVREMSARSSAVGTGASAAELLRECADAIRRSHSHDGKWVLIDSADADAKAFHDRVMEVATKIERLGANLQLADDALDHIARVARAGIQPTRRLDWIAHRADMAIRRRPWDRSQGQPRDSVAALIKENFRLRRALDEAQPAIQCAKRAQCPALIVKSKENAA